MVPSSSSPSQPTWLQIVRLLRWNKPTGRLILMVPALWGVFAGARGTPDWLLVGVIVLGTLATSGTGCVINDLWDRDIDPYVERTKTRPIASKALSVTTGMIVALVGMLCAAILATYLNTFSFALCVAAVPVIVLYPLAKRVFPLPQLVLAIAWGFAILISWSAATGTVETPTWYLWGSTICWTLGFDTVYAMSDREDDLRIGVRSSAIFFGKYTPQAVGVFFAGTAMGMAFFAVSMGLHWIFWPLWGVAVILWATQSWQLAQPEIPQDRYGKIFTQNVQIGFILLVGIVLGNLL
ncbi:4-hydroxybenzoate solanesyltransferase [Geitlerinema sp. PCC 9228]|uniref:4-hydroxybenzoate solanesyltransferase n=1 Tax=Geitlerinema sp. PCC 9228 TaxID=111611 RepID=UPI0008F9B60F|nr:4-hydroxybenzoate solanesyltransferase [Geitlerinema sp. PCC 9228]